MLLHLTDRVLAAHDLTAKLMMTSDPVRVHACR
jgi:hypothetical protein